MSTESSFPFNQATAWQPNPEWVAASNLQAFMARHGIASYPELLARATDDIAWYSGMKAVMADLDIPVVLFWNFYTAGFLTRRKGWSSRAGVWMAR